MQAGHTVFKERGIPPSFSAVCSLFASFWALYAPFYCVYKKKLYLCKRFKTVFIRTVFEWATSGCSCMCSASIVSSITTGFYVSNSKWLMRNASYVTACYSHSCGQKIVCVERYERMHIEMTAEHIKATSVSIATLSKHVDVPRRQRGDDEELLKVINKKQ